MRQLYLILLLFLLAPVGVQAAFAPIVESQEGQELLGKAEMLFDQSAFNSAYILYSQAAANFKKENDWKFYVKAMSGKAHAGIGLRKFQETRLVLDSALEIALKEIPDQPELAQLYHVYGVFFTYLNDGSRALEMHEKALALRLKLLGEKHQKVAESYNGIGEVYRFSLRNYFKAEENFQKCLHILKSQKEPDKKYLFRTYYNLATTNSYIYDDNKALVYGLKSVELLKSMEKINTTWLVTCYNMLANIYNSKNEPLKAIAYYQKVIDMKRSGEGLLDTEIANGYNNLSIAYIEAGNYTRALDYTEKSLEILLNASRPDTSKLIHTFLIKGKAYTSAGNIPEARKSYQHCLQLQFSYRGRNNGDISNTYLHLSRMNKEISKLDSALFYVQEAINVCFQGKSEPVRDFSQLAEKPFLYRHLAEKGGILKTIARDHRGLKNWKEALICYQLSLQLMDLFWESQEGELSRLAFAANNYFVYEEALECAHFLYEATKDDQYLETAFQIMERSKARLFRERVADIQRFHHYQIPDSLLAEERNIKSRIAALQSSLDIEKEDQDPQVLRNELILLEEAYSSWKMSIKQHFPAYIPLPAQENIPPLKHYQAKLDHETVLIEYFYGEECLYIICCTAEKKTIQKIAIENMGTDLQEFQELISTGIQSRSLQEDYARFTLLAFHLYQQLLSAPLQIKTGIKNVLIVPDGKLNSLPFHTLITSKPEKGAEVDYKSLNYAARSYYISYSYDAASHFALPHPAPQDQQHSEELLAFGWTGEQNGKMREAELPGTYKELEAIGQLIEGKFFSGDVATKRNFMMQAGHYNILHLAIHGGADKQNIHKSYLQFSDEKMYHHELYQLGLKSNLTVLSACETGKGKYYSAEGVYSMAHGFSYAGAKSILMTLWKIDDHATAALITNFYQHLMSGKKVNQALNKAQVEYLLEADEYTSHPVYWAGFALWGNHLAYQKTSSPGIMGYLFLCGLILVPIIFLLHMQQQKNKMKRVQSEKLRH